METWKEGLKEYRVIQGIENTYFLEVEYHILRCNKIPEMLPVQIRDQDGTCRLLYEISGMRCMKDVSGKNVFTLQEYRIFLEDCRSLVVALDEYMLDIRQISFDPENIFLEENGHVRWIYSPMVQDDVSGNIVKLFEWLLSMIDYGDMKTVQFAYHAYWCIRNHSFSEKVIRDCLGYKGEEISQYTSASYDELFKEDYAQEDYTGSLGYRDSPHLEEFADYTEPADNHEQRDRLFLAIEILCIIVGVTIAVALITFLIIGLLRNMMREMKYIYLSLIIVLLVLGDCIWQLHKNRNLLSEKRSYHKDSHKELLQPAYNYSWEQEGGTEVLGIRRDMLQPALKDKDNGEICAIEEFPYFIGSNPELNSLVVRDAAVSRRHAVIVRGRQTGYYELQDLRSTNGTWLNQTALVYERPVKLKPGDIIRLASKQFEFVILDSPMGEYHEPQE